MGGVLSRQLAHAVRGLAAVCLMGFAVTACATTPQASSHMPAGSVAMPPAGLLDMCRRAPEVCGAVQADEAVQAGETDDATSLALVSADPGLSGATGATLAGGGDRGDGPKAVHAVPDQEVLAARSNALHADDDGAGETASHDGKPSAAAARDEMAATALPVTQEGVLQAAPALFAVLNDVNQSINMQIRPRDDLDQYGVTEYWTLPLTLEGIAEGDCEDYALEKRRALIEAGVPDSALFLAVGHSRATGRHAVLVVSTDQGDYVLDNMTPRILPWSETPYRWDTRQMPGDLLSWRHMAELVS
jgi:predicted transglutaminase-like cysteine proteinase